MKIIHFSDSHAGGPAEDWMAYIDKRWVGVFNYRFRRKFQHDQRMMVKAVEYIIKEKPDLAICTGDITSTGQPGEFKQSLDILQPLRDSDIPLIYIPGNHDCYVRRKHCIKAMKDAVKYLSKGNLEFDDLPTVKYFGGCEFIIVNESVPTSLLSSCGYMTAKSRNFVIEQCAKEKTGPRILIGHYPLVEDYPLLRFRHRMWGQGKIIELLKQKKIDLSLNGHMHVPYARLDESGRGEICAGSITRNDCLATIEYSGKEDVFKYQNIILEHSDNKM
jgi:predicted MPP superfamily phosphohydrolase